MERIMIVDDEEDILHMLERYFKLNGYRVITAEIMYPVRSSF